MRYDSSKLRNSRRHSKIELKKKQSAKMLKKNIKITGFIMLILKLILIQEYKISYHLFGRFAIESALLPSYFSRRSESCQL